MEPLKHIEKHGDKRKAIMEASLKLFCEKCFQDTSTASISQQAKVATGTLFLYFDSKEELVNELYSESKEELAAYMEEGIWKNKTYKAQLKHIWNRSIEWKLKNPEKLKFMVQFSSSPFITRATREKSINRFSLIKEVVKRAVENKEVVTSSIEMLNALLSGYFNNAAIFLLDNAHNKNLKKWSEEAFELMWKGAKG